MGGVKKGDFICAKSAVSKNETNAVKQAAKLFTKISTAGFTYAGRKHQLVVANL